jgi:hypothetical protein
MRNSGSDKYQVAWMKLLYGITHYSAPRAFGDKTELKLLVVVPPALINVVLKDPNEKGLFRI